MFAKKNAPSAPPLFLAMLLVSILVPVVPKKNASPETLIAVLFESTLFSEVFELVKKKAPFGPALFWTKLLVRILAPVVKKENALPDMFVAKLSVRSLVSDWLVLAKKNTPSAPVLFTIELLVRTFELVLEKKKVFP